MVIKQIQNKGETYYSVCVDYKIFIIQEKHYDSFLTTLKNNFPISEIPRVVDLSSKTKYSHPFFQYTSFNPHLFSHIHTEIANFSKSLELQDIEIWPFIEEVLIGFIICKGYEHSIDYYKQFPKKQDRLFNKSDLIFMRSLKSNQNSNDISQTDLYYYLKDQSIYVIKTWNNNSHSLKKFEKEKTFFQTFNAILSNFPLYLGQVVFQPPRPNIVITFIQGENLHSILTNPNKSEQLSMMSKIKIILSIMACIENLHFYGFVYRDLKFDNIIVTGSDLLFRAATLIDFDACCKLPSKKCEPIDENPKYFFKEEIDYANNIITVLKIDRETKTETFVKIISLTHNFNNSPHEKSKQEMPTDTYGLTNDIGSNYFSSPEQRTSNKYTYTSDIYSLGKFMYYLCIGEIPNEQSEKHIKFPPEYSFLEKLYRQCTRENPSERPNISRVINTFIKLILRLNNNHQSNRLFVWDKRNSYLAGLRLSNCYTFVDNRDGYTYDNYVLNMVCSMAYFLHMPFLKPLGIPTFLLTQQSIEPILSKLYFLSEYYHFEHNALNGRSLGILGYLLYDGMFYPKNEILGSTYLMEGAMRNDSFSQFYLGNLFLDDTAHCNKQTFSLGISLLEKAASTGSPTRINYLAVRYLDNPLFPESFSRGIELLKRSAEQYNSAEGQAILGICCFLNQDFYQAIYYLERSSRPSAKYILAGIYLGDSPELSDYQKGMDYLKFAADNGEDSAQFFLSCCYLRQKLTSEAFKFLTLASKCNSSSSVLLFCLYTAGIFPQKGLEKSLKFLQLSIEQENPMALHIYTQLTRNNKNHPPDLNEYIKSIPSGRQSLSYFVNLIKSSRNPNDDPQFVNYQLSILYDWYLFTFDFDCDIKEFLNFRDLLNSLGHIEKVFEFWWLALHKGQEGDLKALAFINDTSDFMVEPKMMKELFVIEQRLADKNNNSVAQWFLASKLVSGLEYCDIPMRIHYMKAAAENNHPEALCALGSFYISGDLKDYGIPMNIELGINMLNRAAEKGSVSARCELSRLLFNQCLYLSFSYAQEAIGKGCIEAYFPLALCYLRMMKYPEDLFCQKAIECLNITEHKYHLLCKAMLAMIYYDGILASKDEEKSFLLYTELVNTTNREYIHNNLGVILKNGSQSVPKNIPLAIEYFETAIKQGDIFALFNLSRMYFYGEGVPKNIDKAAVLLDKLNMPQFDISLVLNYIQRHPMISTQMFNEETDNCGMHQLLPASCRNLFSKTCFNFIDFVYSIHHFPFLDIFSDEQFHKQLKSEIVTTTFYEGLL